MFPVIYIPVINTKVFLHKSITWEWGLLLVLLHCSCWEQKLGNGASVCLLVAPKPKPEYELERNDPFQRYASFSRANTMVV